MYQNRTYAGKELAKALNFLNGEDLVILAMPRGGVPVAYEVAKELKAPLEVFITRKLAVPWQPEYGIGAITETGEMIINKEDCSRLGIDELVLKDIINDQEIELTRRKKLYRHGRPLIDVKDKVVVLIDDGLATGVTAQVTIQALKKLKAKEIIFAVPVSPKSCYEKFSNLCKFITLLEKEPFYAVGNFYEDFTQLNDCEVLHYLNRAKEILNKDEKTEELLFPWSFPCR